jgi:alkanesulfonate monooxygenase SsuD/methylene tetrahydromethanopterin reductase-like flavin-dependent oxidoreductase (luciferase family)
MAVRACAPASTPTTFAALVAFATAAERAGYDHLVLERGPGFDPPSAAAALVPFAHAIRLCAEVTVDRGEPITLARGLAALDHLSGGRAAWRIADVSDIARGREFVAVTRLLWQSWQADAIVFDKASAIFSDPDKVARIDHDGAAFQVRGPLNTPRPPQGCLPLLVDAGSPFRDLADIVIGERNATLVRCSAGDLTSGARP